VGICNSSGARRPYLHSAQRPSALHCDCRRAHKAPSKGRNSSHLTEGRKEIISTTTRTLHGVTYSLYLSLRNIARVTGEKIQNLNYGAQVIKILTKSNSRCMNLNEE
jgi:hypothetical protein